MNCDRVFMILTQGPFPTGAPEDSAVQSHLDQCVSCWRFAQALRPVEDPQHLSSIHEEGLPGYWGDLPSPRDETAGQISPNPSPTATVAHRLRVAQRIEPAKFAPRTASREDLLWVLGLVGGVGLCVLVGWWLMSPVR